MQETRILKTKYFFLSKINQPSSDPSDHFSFYATSLAGTVSQILKII